MATPTLMRSRLFLTSFGFALVGLAAGWPILSGSRFGARPTLSLEGATSTIWCLNGSPDGARLAGACHDKTVRVWDAATGQVLLTLAGHTGPVRWVCFSKDGRFLASAAPPSFRGPGEIKVWDALTGKEVLTPEGAGGFALALSPDGKRVAGPGRDGTVKVWAVPGGQVLLSVKNARPGRMAFSPDGKLLAGGCDKRVKVWDSETGKVLLSLEGGGAAALCFSPDGLRLAGASGCEVRVWDPTSGKEELFLRHVHANRVRDLAFTPDGRSLVSAGNRPYRGWEPWPPSDAGEVKVWDSSLGKELLAFTPHRSGLWAAALAPDGRHLATSPQALGEPVKVWALTLGE